MPGFEPSPESYAVAQAFYELAGDRLAAAGANDPDDLDLFTAIVSGLSHQQVANDPGGDRWVRLSRRAVEMYLADVDRHPKTDGTTPPKGHPMMTSAAIDVTTIERITHDEAMAITAVENRKFVEQLRSLDADDWTKPTACERWDVRAMAAHVVGAAAGQISPREFLRQVRAGRPVVKEIGAQYWWDGMNEIQVRERAELTTDELIAEWVTQRREGPGRPHQDAATDRPPAPAEAAGTGRSPAARLPVRHRLHPRRLGPPHGHRRRHRSPDGPRRRARRSHRRRHRRRVGGDPRRAVRPRADRTGRRRLHRGHATGSRSRIDTLDFITILAERAEGTGVLRNTLPL